MIALQFLKKRKVYTKNNQQHKNAKTKKIYGIIAALCVLITCSSWGFFAHRRINQLAIFSLPKEMLRFYKFNSNFITVHAVDPDKRRYVDSLEGPRHFLDVDRYGTAPFDSIPKKWKDAVGKYSQNKLLKNGTVPWQIEKTYYALIKAFQVKDSLYILKLSADLGHYIADAHVPLHTTENYNGQLSNQIGIHGFWESRLPELFADEYNYLVGPAKYIVNPLEEAWKVVRHTFQYKDDVLLIEARLNKQFSPDRKYEFSKRKGRLGKQYSKEYAKSYHDALNGMIERQMRASILSVASFWYSAWVDAGQPELANFKSSRLSKKELKDVRKEKKSYRQKKIIGREDH